MKLSGGNVITLICVLILLALIVRANAESNHVMKIMSDDYNKLLSVASNYYALILADPKISISNDKMYVSVDHRLNYIFTIPKVEFERHFIFGEMDIRPSGAQINMGLQYEINPWFNISGGADLINIFNRTNFLFMKLKWQY